MGKFVKGLKFIGIRFLILLGLLLVNFISIYIIARTDRDISEGTRQTKAGKTEKEALEDTLEFVFVFDCLDREEKLWYCNSTNLIIREIIPYRRDLYAWGTAVAPEGKEFVWAADMEGSEWVLYFNESQGLPECSEIFDFPPSIFNGMFSKCINEGIEISRE